jgi:uncharacterized membrane protein
VKVSLINLAFLISIAFVIGGVGITIFFPPQAERFTEFYILGTGGLASDYPTTVLRGEDQNLTIGIGNREGRDIGYTLEIMASQAFLDANTSALEVQNIIPLDSFFLFVPQDSTETLNYTFQLNSNDINRLDFLLFDEQVPSKEVKGTDRINASYRNLRLWIKVVE